MAGFLFTIDQANTRATTNLPSGLVGQGQRVLGQPEERRLLMITGRAKPPGFTLIELMVALAILALLLLLGVPSFTTFMRNSEIRSTAESIINGLRAASTEAANRNAPRRVHAGRQRRRRLDDQSRQGPGHHGARGAADPEVS